MKKFIAALAGCLMIAGCAAEATGPGTPTSAEPARPLPADQLVFSVDISAMSDYQAYVSNVVELAIYGDGRVYRVVDTATSSRVTATYELGQLDPANVAEFAAATTRSKLLDPDTGYGKVTGVQDASSTTVTLHDRAAEQIVSVYAPDIDSGLSLAQARNRKKLRGLIDQAEKLADTASFTPAVIDRAQVVQTKEWNPSGPQWPGPDPTTFLAPITGSSFGRGCGEITGPEAVTVLDAAAKNESTYHWMVNGQPTLLVVRPLLPGEEACTQVT